MLISKICNLPIYSLESNQIPEHNLTGWTLKWQQKQLIVKARQKKHQANIEFSDAQWLQECLQKSSVKIVKVDPAIGLTNLKSWATACQQAEKLIFLRASDIQKPSYLNSFSWRVKRFCDIVIAIALLVVLSPLILGIIGWGQLKSPQSPVFNRQWHVGKRGQLFQLFKFNSVKVGHRKYWQYIPQLFNVLRGEMSLVGTRPWTLAEATKLQPKQLNTLPGISGLSALKKPLINHNNATSLSYLNSWSLSQDFKIIRQTLQKVLFGSIH